MSGPFEWTDERVRLLRILCDQGLSYEKIARRLGCTKNAAIGKARRIGVAQRGAVIQYKPVADDSRMEQAERMLRDGYPVKRIAAHLRMDKTRIIPLREKLGIAPLANNRHTAKRDPRVKVAQKMLRAGVAASNVETALHLGWGRTANIRDAIGIAPKILGESRRAVYIPPAERARRAEGICCQWPFGEPGRKGFRFCEAVPVVPGRSYCAEHMRVAYVRHRSFDTNLGTGFVYGQAAE